ncbi:uncharacterized protein KD926_005457 [Aspergillus affinis]|uniref:uncharacterized protein n=1 Tax=Aspergillus affinis TaxID=1070780 RepID=UPI0022FE4D47|nr:uncharacterized protein KD926_005457 [Aspergillus affinis]KAI9034809.1 hypothetical protein KD926_005457 [Aspergillus affinis]
MAGKRKAKQLVVPDIAEDAAERKRVLNILAQRRYRQRKKDHLHALESRAKSPSGRPVSTHDTSSASSLSSMSFDVLDNIYQTLNRQEDQESNVQVMADQNGECTPPQIITSDPFVQFVSTTAPQSDIGLSIIPDDSFLPPFDFWPDPETRIPQNEGPVETPSHQSVSTNRNDRLDISTALQTSETSSFSFPDDRILEVPSLMLLNAATKVAYRLNLAHLIWDLSAISPFYRPRESSNPSTSPLSLGNSSTPASSLASTPSVSVSDPDHNHNHNPNTDNPDLTTLPPHLQPTLTQRLIPDHPVLDLLPWPGTRDKLIQVFNLPDHLRPKSAQDPMGLTRLVYDMEDIGGEGIKV